MIRFLWNVKDGGPESKVWMWGIESKRIGSVLILRFAPGSREAFHTHAFNALSWVLAGVLIEQTLSEKGPAWSPDQRNTWAGFGPSLKPVFTSRRRFHKVQGGARGAWAITFRGPWWSGWREYDPATGSQTKLTSGRRHRK